MTNVNLNNINVEYYFQRRLSKNKQPQDQLPEVLSTNNINIFSNMKLIRNCY